MPHLSYIEYYKLGGTIDESAFPIYAIQAENYVNYITNNKISRLEEIPTCVKLLETRIISLLFQADKSLNSNNGLGSLKSYSNGIESFSYENSQFSEENLKVKFMNLAKLLLSGEPCLICRRVRCDERCNNYSKQIK